MEKFDAYAQSLLNQNIIPLNEAMNNLENFSRMERATRLLANPTNGILEEFRDTHILEIRNLSKMQLRLFGIIFRKQINLIQILPRNHPTLTFLREY